MDETRMDAEFDIYVETAPRDEFRLGKGGLAFGFHDGCSFSIQGNGALKLTVPPPGFRVTCHHGVTFVVTGSPQGARIFTEERT